MTTTAARDMLAEITVAALREKVEAEISIGATTAGSPLIKVDFGDGLKFHLTVTRARI